MTFSGVLLRFPLDKWCCRSLKIERRNDAGGFSRFDIGHFEKLVELDGEETFGAPLVLQENDDRNNRDGRYSYRVFIGSRANVFRCIQLTPS